MLVDAIVKGTAKVAGAEWAKRSRLRRAGRRCLRRLEGIVDAHAASRRDIVQDEKYHLGPELDEYGDAIDGSTLYPTKHAKVHRAIRRDVLLRENLDDVSTDELQRHADDLAKLVRPQSDTEAEASSTN